MGWNHQPVKISFIVGDFVFVTTLAMAPDWTPKKPPDFPTKLSRSGYATERSIWKQLFCWEAQGDTIPIPYLAFSQLSLRDCHSTKHLKWDDFFAFKILQISDINFNLDASEVHPVLVIWVSNTICIYIYCNTIHIYIYTHTHIQSIQIPLAHRINSHFPQLGLWGIRRIHPTHSSIAPQNNGQSFCFGWELLQNQKALVDMFRVDALCLYQAFTHRFWDAFSIMYSQCYSRWLAVMLKSLGVQYALRKTTTRWFNVHIYFQSFRLLDQQTTTFPAIWKYHGHFL